MRPSQTGGSNYQAFRRSSFNAKRTLYHIRSYFDMAVFVMKVPKHQLGIMENAVQAFAASNYS